MAKRKTAGEPRPEKKKSSRPKSAPREIFEWVSSLGLALGAALLIKAYVADVYSIPTGSMEPTLHGVAHGGDRVFCPKVSYRLREEGGPRRWEIFVFKYPAGQPGDNYYGENFIKRCVALPGEKVYFRDGDLYIAGMTDLQPSISRKPGPLQRQLWIPVYREDFERNSPAALEHHWTRSGSGGDWMLSGGRLRGETRKAIHLAFRPMVAGREMPGITDRHIKRQVVTFRCPECGGFLRKTVRSQQLTGYCPACETFLRETDILPNYSVYHCPDCGRKTRRLLSDGSPQGYCESCVEVGDDAFVGQEWNFPDSGLYRDLVRDPERSDGMKRGRLDPLHLVRDRRIACTLLPRSDAGTFRIELSAGEELWQARVPLGGGTVSLLHNGRTVEEADAGARLRPGAAVRLSLAICDRAVEFRLGGDEDGIRLRHEVESPLPAAGEMHAKNGILLSLADGRADLDGIAIDRDVYYYWVSPAGWADRDRPPPPDALGRMMAEEMYMLPEDGFMACGDNQPRSNDSRNWGPVPRENLIGPALFIWWPPHRIRILK